MSPAWSAGTDARRFTTVQSAINTATGSFTPPPSADNPVIVEIEPGTYTENVVCKTGVWLVAAEQAHVEPGSPFGSPPPKTSVIIDGTLLWAPVDAGDEFVHIAGITVMGKYSLDTSGKPNGIATLVGENILLFDEVSGIGGVTGTLFFSDYVIYKKTTTKLLVVTLADGIMGDGSIMNFEGPDNATGLLLAKNVAFSGKAIFKSGVGGFMLGFPIFACFFGEDVTAADTNTQVAIGNSLYFKNPIGPGTVDRGLFRMSFGPTTGGGVGDAVTFACPYSQSNYYVNLTQVAGPAGFPPLITARTGTGFTLTDPNVVGGRTYEMTIVEQGDTP